MMKRWGGTTVALAGLALASCGGGESESAPIAEEAEAEIASICREIRPEISRLAKQQDKTEQVPEQVELLGQQEGLLTDLATQIQGVEPPAELAPQVKDLTDALEDQQGLAADLQTALPQGGLEEVQGLLLDGVDYANRVDAAARDLDLEACAPDEVPTRKDVLALFSLDVGAPVTLSAAGTDITMSVDGVIDPVPAGFVSPSEGSRFVGIRLTVKNSGNRPIEVPLDFQSTLVTSAGQRLTNSELDVAGDCETTLTLDLGPADSAQGCLAYEVPERATAEGFEFGGGEGETIEWDLTTAKPESGIPEGEDPESATGGYLGCIEAAQTADDINACTEQL